jgi:ATP-dependent Lon protease
MTGKLTPLDFMHKKYMPYPFSTPVTTPPSIKFSEGEDQIRFIAMPDDEDLPKDDPTARPDELPILPLKNTVLFPGVVLPITVGRAASLKLLRDAYENGRVLGVCTQRDDDVEDPRPKTFLLSGCKRVFLKEYECPMESTTYFYKGVAALRLKNLLKQSPTLRQR